MRKSTIPGWNHTSHETKHPRRHFFIFFIFYLTSSLIRKSTICIVRYIHFLKINHKSSQNKHFGLGCNITSQKKKKEQAIRTWMQNHKSSQNKHFGLGCNITSQARTSISDLDAISQVKPEQAFRTWMQNHKSSQNKHFGLRCNITRIKSWKINNQNKKIITLRFF